MAQSEAGPFRHKLKNRQVAIMTSSLILKNFTGADSSFAHYLLIATPLFLGRRSSKVLLLARSHLSFVGGPFSLYFFWVSVEEEVRHHLITRYIYCWNRTLQLKEDPSHDICVRCHINLWGQRTPNRASSAARHRSSRQHPPIPFPLTQPSPIRWWAWEGY